MSYRTVRLISVFLALALVSVWTGQTVQADSPSNEAYALGLPNLRVGPGTNFAILASLPNKDVVIIEGRNDDMSWILVHEKTGKARGWGKTTLFKIAADVKLSAVPISDQQVTPTGQAITTFPSLPGDLAKNTSALPYVPVLTPRMISIARGIYARGLALGNNPHVFTKVGDCHTDHPAFLQQFGTDKYNLGGYGNLQEVIAYYSTAPRPGQANSFIAQSQAAHSAFTSEAVLAKTAILDPSICQANEAPLDCEYRLDKPSVAIIMFGVVDVELMTAQQFNFYMRYIVQETMHDGIIPVLSTAGTNAAYPEKSRLFNQIVVTLANTKGIPLINLAAALDKLPNKGMDADGIHLTRPADVSQTGFFSPENLQYGYTMRNLLTLQTLDELIKQVQYEPKQTTAH